MEGLKLIWLNGWIILCSNSFQAITIGGKPVTVQMVSGQKNLAFVAPPNSTATTAYSGSILSSLTKVLNTSSIQNNATVTAQLKPKTTPGNKDLSWIPIHSSPQLNQYFSKDASPIFWVFFFVAFLALFLCDICVPVRLSLVSQEANYCCLPQSL